MKQVDIAEIIDQIDQAANITFLTGAGVSTASGIPDYRSLKGVYHGAEQPEYLLSKTALLAEPQKFYEFVKRLYHPAAKPNVIHHVLAALELRKQVRTVSQNIDQLHRLAGSQHLVEFHGTLYKCCCLGCGCQVPWQAYLESDRHAECGGQIRPEIILYEEGLPADTIETAVAAVAQAELLVIVGTTFHVHPFCDLIHYRRPGASVVGINQSPIDHEALQYFYEGDAVKVFKKIQEKLLRA